MKRSGGASRGGALTDGESPRPRARTCGKVPRMPMSTIAALAAHEILDSRGRPTVSATCRLSSGAIASVSVPSGASTGKAESCELRDGDPQRYRGLGCRRAVANIQGEIAADLVGRSFDGQAALDHALIALDGTSNKARLGSNAVLAVSIAFARAVARGAAGPSLPASGVALRAGSRTPCRD